MKELYQRLKTALGQIDASLPKALSSNGVSEEMIHDLEANVSKKLPADFLSFYQVCNGQIPHGDYLVDGEEFLSFSRILDEWFVWKDLLDSDTFSGDGNTFSSEPEEGIKPDWWNPAWIPFTYNGAGDHLCLDLDPTSGGNYGQIIRMWHDGAERTLEHASFTEWLNAYIEDLEQRKYSYGNGYLEKKEEPIVMHKQPSLSFWQGLLAVFSK